jgi:hypothetical protein
MQVCEHLSPIFDKAISAGCAVRGESRNWSEAELVVHLSRRLPPDMRGLAQPPVVYYESGSTPHSAGDEGYFCRACREGLSFPTIE